ncbi:SDR family oxidoreductase [Verrucomicrobium spinosum]|uniref:SDR family oxidoreductase n=1 Tax=Verrucomicrobium spinosum TaxID=2736 RepID=UPI0005C5A6FE|nr:SDR family NAD(P)-dependent oxidoreductase [Verrucomicrobium spinosum]
MVIPTDSLKGKVAVVTGAGSGLGKATAKVLAHAGARVLVLGRTAEEIQCTAEEIHHGGGEAMAIEADVAKDADVKAAMARAVGTEGRIDVVFANAGINGVWAPIELIEEKEWDETLAINLKGTFLTIKHALPFMRQEGGSVVVTASINGTRIFSNSGATAYACSKAGQVALVKMLALELARHRIRVNVICPGAIESRIDESTEKRELEGIHLPVEFPQGNVPLTGGGAGAAGQVAELVWFLASDLSSHITGTEVYIDGAQSLLQG